MMSKLEIITQIAIKALENESTRVDNLTRKAEKFITVVAIVMGFQIIDLKNVVLSGVWYEVLPSWLAVSALVMLGVALVTSLSGLRVRGYVSYPKSKDLLNNLLMKVNNFPDNKMSEEIVKMCLNVTDKNSNINNKRAKLLSWTGFSCLLALSLQLLVICQLGYLIDFRRLY